MYVDNNWLILFATEPHVETSNFIDKSINEFLRNIARYNQLDMLQRIIIIE